MQLGIQSKNIDQNKVMQAMIITKKKKKKQLTVKLSQVVTI